MWTTILTAILIIAIASGFYWLILKNKRNEFYKTKNIAGINSQRDIIERNIYREETKILEDSHNFIDTTKLLIKFAAQSPFSQRIPNYTFFEGLGIDFTNLNIEENTAFCLMPFNNEFKILYSIIKGACNKKDVICHRSDESYEPGNLLKQIILSIIKSQYIFAVLDGRNPNVFYEIGLCHAIGKPVFLIANNKQKERLPFDVTSSRLILYKNHIHLGHEIQAIIDQYTI